MAAFFFLQKNKNVNNACAKVPEFPVVWLTVNFKLQAILKNHVVSTIQLAR